MKMIQNPVASFGHFAWLGMSQSRLTSAATQGLARLLTRLRLASASTWLRRDESARQARGASATARKLWRTALLFAVAVSCGAQTLTQTATVTAPAPSAWMVVSQGLNWDLYQRTNYELLASGEVIPHVESYRALASGRNFFNPATGRLEASKEEIDAVPGGFAATNGQSQLFCPSDLATGTVRLITPWPESLVLESQPINITYSDGTNYIILATLTNSAAELVGSNEVLYPAALVGPGGFKCDVCFVYRKSGAEQDIIFRTKPASPESISGGALNSANVKVQVTSVFYNCPTPGQTAEAVDPRTGLGDVALTFAGMKMIQGRAFLTGVASDNSQVGTYKNWIPVDSSSSALVEQVPYSQIAASLATLPLGVAAVSPRQSGRGYATTGSPRQSGPPPRGSSGATGSSALPGNARVNRRQSGSFALPVYATSDFALALRKASSEWKRRRVINQGLQASSPTGSGSKFSRMKSIAGNFPLPHPPSHSLLRWAGGRGSVAVRRSPRQSGSSALPGFGRGSVATPGFCFDYIAISGDETNYVFRGDQAYFLDAPVYLYGTTVIEGASIIKANTNGQINIESGGTVDCRTGPYSPALFSSYNENDIGDWWGNGNPALGDVNTFLNFTSGSTNVLLHDLHFAYAKKAVTSSGSISLWDCEFVDVATAVDANSVGLYNVLIGRTVYTNAAVVLEGTNMVGENVTADYGSAFIQANAAGTTIALTNCLVTSQPLLAAGNSATLQTNAVVNLLAPSGPVYQVCGGGSYYLTNSSPYATNGTANIDPDLLADLQGKTVWPPKVYAGTNISALRTLSPFVARDTNSSPPIGFSYDPLDDVLGGSDLCPSDQIMRLI